MSATLEIILAILKVILELSEIASQDPELEMTHGMMERNNCCWVIAMGPDYKKLNTKIEL